MYAFSLITYKFEKTTCKIMMSIKPSTKTVKFKALLYSRNVFNLSTVEEDIFSKCMIMMLMKLPPNKIHSPLFRDSGFWAKSI